MAVGHAKAVTIGDFTGTVTVFNSQGSTTTANATDLVRVTDWNSAHSYTQNLAGNTTGTSQVSGTDIVWAGGNGILLSANGATVSIIQNPNKDWQWQPPGQQSSSQITVASASIQNVYLPAAIAFTRVDIPVINTITSSATTNTHAQVITSAFVIYTANGATLSPVVGAVGTTTYTCASNTSNFSQVTGAKMFTFPVQTTLSAGEYYIGLGLSTQTSSVGLSTTSLANNISIFINSTYTALPFNIMGNASSSNANDWLQQGVWSTQITATSRTIALTDIVQSGTAFGRVAFPIYFEG